MTCSLLVDAAVLMAEDVFGRRGATRVTLCNADDIPGALTTGEFDGVVVRSTTRLNNRLLDGTDVRFAATATVGVDHVDEAYLRERGIHFAHAAGSSAQSVAEYTLAAAAITLERLGQPSVLTPKTLAIVGHGAIGSRVATGARLMGWTTLSVDPILRRAGNAEIMELEEALSAADLVTLHVPLTTDGDHPTLNMVDAHFLQLLPKGAIFINTSRGDVVDEDALLDALRSGDLSGAALDVFRSEPRPRASLLSLTQLSTPHAAGRTLDGMLANTVAIGEAFARYTNSGLNQADAPALPAAPVLSKLMDGSLEALVEAAWGLSKIEEMLRGTPTDFRGAREIAGQRRDLSMHTLPPHASSEQQRFHEILRSL